MVIARSRLVTGRRWFAVLASLALLMQVLVPQGFMVANANGAPHLVVCTGHGPLNTTDPTAPGKAPKPASAGICAFAGHGAANAPPPAEPLVVAQAALVPPLIAATADVGPAQGLAAPPPQSHAPPISLA
jgi:hypothetical protein